jgi:hypothetical protein
MRTLCLVSLLGACGTTGATPAIDAPPGVVEDARPADAPPVASSGPWLHVTGNHIYTSDNEIWHGRGANIHDTRSCNACAYNGPVAAEVMRRVDELVDNWHANFMRLDLESYDSAGGRAHWAGVLDDAGYLADIQAIVAHIAAKPGVYVLLSEWVDPTFTSLGWPTDATRNEWRKLAQTFVDEPRVLFGLINEPQSNFDGAMDADCWTAMNETVAAIRGVEDAAGTPHHIITVQGTGGWARRLDYYVTHPIAAGGGDNVAYEVHVYDPTANFAGEWVNPAKTLPVVIGEFGPASGYMTEDDCKNLIDAARTAEVPHLAWTFHPRCPPNLLVDNTAIDGGCGVGMKLEPTSWGTLLKDRLAIPW